MFLTFSAFLFVYCFIWILFLLNAFHIYLCLTRYWSEADPEILKEAVLYVGHHGWPTKKILGFTWSKNSQNNVRNYKFLGKYFYQHFQIFSIFIYNESLPMKSYQFFKIYTSFDKEREKTLMRQSMRKEKLRKVGLCFTTGCFIKSINLIINFLFCKLIGSPIFAFWYKDDARNIKRGSRE